MFCQGRRDISSDSHDARRLPGNHSRRRRWNIIICSLVLSLPVSNGHLTRRWFLLLFFFFSLSLFLPLLLSSSSWSSWSPFEGNREHDEKTVEEETTWWWSTEVSFQPLSLFQCTLCCPWDCLCLFPFLLLRMIFDSKAWKSLQIETKRHVSWLSFYSD